MQKLSEMEVGKAIEVILAESEEPITLLDVVKKAVPELAEESIKAFMHFLVNDKKVTDWKTTVSKDDVVKVIPQFAGGK